jgi:TetR/AcrR family transcriptional regulator
MGNRDTTRPPGRPKSGSGHDPRERLLTTAARLFAARGFEGTSLRQVADGAGVTSAMVAYYFSDKAGLLEAVVMDGLSHILDAVESAVADSKSTDAFLARLVTAYLDVINRHPWIPSIMVREVISRDSALRDLVRREFMERAVMIVPPAIARDIAANRLRADLDPAYTVLSIVGMCVFPYMAEPVLGPLLGYRIDESFGQRYSEHAIGLILSGAGAGP